MSISTKQWVVDDISSATIQDLTTDNIVAYFYRLKKLTFTIDAKQQQQYAGDSKYSFHLTEQDSASMVQVENAELDFNELIMATGASVSTGSTVVPAAPELLTVDTSHTVTLSKGATMVANSEKVIVATKGMTNSGVQLTRVASAPAANEYTIAAGVITFGDTTLDGKDVRVFYNYTATSAETLSITTTTKNKAYKFVAHGKAYDDELNTTFDVVVIIYKTQMLGTFSFDQHRKTATTNTMDLAIMDANRSDNKVIDIIAVA